MDEAIKLTRQQQEAVDQIAAWAARRDIHGFFSLTGPAGSGKTTVLRLLRPILGRATVWAAMTGKAAARMKEAAGVKAKTLHSALYHMPTEVDNVEERKIDLEFNEVRIDRDDEDEAILVVDEASMLTCKMTEDLRGSNFRKILFVGDPYQLPPIEDDYSIFSVAKGPELTEVQRTAGAVVNAATALRETDTIHIQNESDDRSRYDFEYYSSADSTFIRALELWLEDREDHVILTWKNKNRMHMNRTIRETLGIKDVEGKDDRLPQRGEPVVICQNVHDQQLMNGDMVRIDEWLHKGPTFSGTDRESQNFSIRAGCA